MASDHVRADAASVALLLSGETEGTSSRGEFLAALISLLTQLVPADIVAWNAVDRGDGTAEVFEPDGLFRPEVVALLTELDDHPMIVSYFADIGDVSPRRLSDLVTPHELRRTRTWTDLFEPWGVHHQLTVLSHQQRSGTVAGCFTFNRSAADFTDDDVDILEALQPALFALDRVRATLPRSVPEREDARIRAGLTAREAQVLELVADGLTAHSCATALRISHATVRKHLENAYATLGCHDRVSAVTRARRLGVLGSPRDDRAGA